MAHKRRGSFFCHSLAIPAGNRDNAAQPIFAAAMLAAQDRHLRRYGVG